MDYFVGFFLKHGFIFFSSLGIGCTVFMLLYSYFVLDNTLAKIKDDYLHIGLGVVLVLLGFLSFQTVDTNNFSTIFHNLEIIFVLLFACLFFLRNFGSKRFILHYFYWHTLAISLLLVAFVGVLSSGHPLSISLKTFNLSEFRLIEICLTLSLLIITAIPPFTSWFTRINTRLHSKDMLIFTFVLPILSFILIYKFVSNHPLIKWVGFITFAYGSFYAAFSRSIFRIISYLIISFFGMILVGMNFIDGVISFGLFVFFSILGYNVIIIVYDLVLKNYSYLWDSRQIYLKMLEDRPNFNYLGIVLLLIIPSLAFLSPTLSFFTVKEVLYSSASSPITRLVFYIFCCFRGIAFAKLLYPFIKLKITHKTFISTDDLLITNDKKVKFLPLLLLAIFIFTIDLFFGLYLFYFKQIFWITNIFSDKFVYNLTFFIFIFGIIGFYLIDTEKNINCPDVIDLLHRYTKLTFNYFYNLNLKPLNFSVSLKLPNFNRFTKYVTDIKFLFVIILVLLIVFLFSII